MTHPSEAAGSDPLWGPPDSRHDPEAAHYIKPALNTAPYNLGSPPDSRHDPEAALYMKPTLYTSPGGEADDFEYWMLYSRPTARTSAGELVLAHTTPSRVSTRDIHSTSNTVVPAVRPALF